MSRSTLPLNTLAALLAAYTLAAAPASTNYWPLSDKTPPLPWAPEYLHPDYIAPVDGQDAFAHPAPPPRVPGRVRSLCGRRNEGEDGKSHLISPLSLVNLRP